MTHIYFEVYEEFGEMGSVFRGKISIKGEKILNCKAESKERVNILSGVGAKDTYFLD